MGSGTAFRSGWAWRVAAFQIHAHNPYLGDVYAFKSTHTYDDEEESRAEFLGEGTGPPRNLRPGQLVRGV